MASAVVNMPCHVSTNDFSLQANVRKHAESIQRTANPCMDDIRTIAN
jgi:hypothetical protein